MSGSLERLTPRLDALLVDRATQGLAPPEEAELRQLLLAEPGADLESIDAVQSFELAAAAIHLTSPAVGAPMPAAIEARLRERARMHFSGDASSASAPSQEQTQGQGQRERQGQGAGWSRGFGWLAAAACLALAVLGWWPRLQAPPVASAPPAPEPSLEERVAAADDLLRLPWTVLEDPAVSAATSGEVLWSNELQAGFMRFAGLQPNDPEEVQYQLWIFDQEQDERFPVDGGVFDVGPGGEVVVPIRAKLGIVDPTLFAVTVERPGGVVVSSRERIVVLAQVS
jgi:Anti-sigma-K factor rskA, C-terminal